MKPEHSASTVAIYSHIRFLMRSLLAGIVSLTLAFSVQAQTETAESDDSEENDDSTVALDKVAVTGSRIPSANIISPIPTQSLDRDEIEESGSVDVGEIIEQIPGVYLGLSPTNTLLSTQNAGLSTVSLRALSTNRTLTLINGRRVVSNSGNAQRVDTGTIPSAFVSRIDITTGGASAAYGSDAIAGVANIVLVDEFTGFSVDTRVGASDEGGAETNSIDAAWGMDFANGRGNIMIGAMYGDRGSVFATERDYAESDLEIDLETGELEINRSSFLPGGRFEGDAWNIGGVWQNDVDGSQYCIDDGRVPACDDYQAAFDGYDFRPFSMLSPERERWSTMVKGRYDFDNDVTAWGMFQFSNIETLAQRAAANAQDATSYGEIGNETRIGDMPSDHPFIHPAVQETLSGTVDWRRRFVEVGQRFRASDRETARFSFGLDGQFDANWQWSAYLGYGNHEQNQIRENELNLQKIDFALDIEADPAAPGSFRCVDATARADGCVPLNVFGEGSVTVAAADYIRATDRLSQELDQTTASFTVNGALAELPAGALLTAFGIDYRKEEQKTLGDPDTNAGLTTTGFIPDIEGEFDVTEAFVELNVPLIADKPGIQALDLTTAYRYADYSTVGNVSSWNLGLSYAPNDSIRFRSQISQAQRAPDITELFSTQRSDFDGLDDPCDGVTATSTGTVATNCRAIAGIAATIAENGVYEQDGSSVFGPNSGNPNLKEETADTFTAGFVLTPQALPGFSFIADYYNIEVEDAISSVSSQLTTELCLNDPGFPNNKFCDVITRDIDGQITRIVNQEENLNVLESEGVDVTIAYDFDIPGVPGNFNMKTIWAHLMTNEERFNGVNGEETDQFVGVIGLPEDEYRFTLRWRNNGLNIRYRTNYIGSAVDDLTPDPADVAADLKVGSEMIHDLYASYTFNTDHQYRVYLGVNNIGDNHGPYLPDGYVNGANSNVNSSYDVIGRRWYLGMDFSW